MARAYTKELIQKAFVECLDEMPLGKISVTEIARRCEINRNTFYYYYSDIYAVLNEILDLELEQAISRYNRTQSWEEGFIQGANFALQHRIAVSHIYHSMQREELEQFLFHIAGDVMIRFVHDQNEEVGASEETCRSIAFFYQCALTQMILQWIASGMQMDADRSIRRTGELFNGNIKISLERSLGLSH